MDLLPTFAGLAGAELPADRVIDGKDIWPVLTGKEETPHESFFYYRDNDLRAVRSGKWKLHLTTTKVTAKGIGKNPGAALFDLESDISEKKNVLKDHPDIEKRLRSYVTKFEKDLAGNSRPAGSVENPKPLSGK